MTWDEQELSTEFAGKYVRFVGFIGSSFRTEYVAAVQDETLLRHICFCNNVLHIAQVKNFLIARKTHRPSHVARKESGSGRLLEVHLQGKIRLPYPAMPSPPH